MILLLLSISSIGVFAADESDVGALSAEESFFGLVFEEIKANSENILSALAFAASLLVAFTYKKGLLPNLKSGIERLSDAVSKLRDASKEQSENSSLALGTAGEHLENAKNALEAILERLSRLENELSYAKETRSEREEFKLILLSQTDMLYDIFMNSSLPQYQKDIVGEKIAAMKESIKKGE